MIIGKNSQLAYQLVGIFFCAFVPTIYGKAGEGYFQNVKNPSYDYGATNPRGDIYLYLNAPLELDCLINVEKAKAAGFTVEDLIFKKEDEIIDPSYVKRVGENGIRLYMKQLEPSESMYFCYLQKNTSTESNNTSPKVRSKMVDMNWVVAGAEPQPLLAFACIYLNWQKIYCTWEPPRNYLRTNYSLVPDFYNSNEEESNRCEIDGDKKNFCQWSVPHHHSLRPTTDIITDGRNSFKSILFNSLDWHWYYLKDPHKNVVLQGPKNVRLLAANKTSMTLQWDIAENLNNPLWPIEYKIQYKSIASDWHVFLCETVTIDGLGVSCTISGLSSATDYYVNVFVKSSAAPERYWSQNYGAQIFSTK